MIVKPGVELENGDEQQMLILLPSELPPGGNAQQGSISGDIGGYVSHYCHALLTVVHLVKHARLLIEAIESHIDLMHKHGLVYKDHGKG